MMESVTIYDEYEDDEEERDDQNSNFDRDNPTNPMDTSSMINKIRSNITDLEDTIEEEDITDKIRVRAQIDTGASVSVTNRIDLLHNYRPFDEKRRCPIRLTGAINGAEPITPEGLGSIRVPVNYIGGYIDVQTYYSPKISSTLLSDNCIRKGAIPSNKLDEYSGQTLHKLFQNKEGSLGKMLIVNHHKRNKAKNVTIHGVVRQGQYYTQHLIPPHHTIKKSFKKSESTRKLLQTKLDQAVEEYVQQKLFELDIEIIASGINEEYREPLEELIKNTVPVRAIRTRTEKMLWHQRLGHPNDDYLHDAHKYIKGVPKFERQSKVLDHCPTCIQSKQTKEPAGKKTTKTATVPFQGLSIDFAFSGMRSKNDDRRLDYEGMNGETCYILITDHVTGMKIGDTRLSKAPPIIWLKNFLEKHDPKCEGKYAFMDQGGELYKSPDIHNLFEQYGYDLRPTGADNSRQNGPVERAHRTIGNMIRCLLHGAGLDAKFWPYAFYHALRLMNAIPQKKQGKSPTELASGRKEDFGLLRTFGCRVWVRPPQGRTSKFRNNSRKGILLGYTRGTVRNILWYDLETSRVKIASHARFDEGMNDLHLEAIPPNVQQLQRSDDGIRIPAETEEIEAADLQFYESPFHNVHTKTLVLDSSKPHGLTIASDQLSKRAYVSDIKNNSPASKLFSTPRATRNKIKGAYIISINGDPVFTKEDVYNKLQQLRDQGVTQMKIDFAPITKLNSKQFNRARNEFGLLSPNTNPKPRIIHEEIPEIQDREPVQLPTALDKDSSIGTRMAKRFNEEIFYGTVQELWKEKDKKRWRVIYDDGDSEDLNEREMKTAKELYKKHPEVISDSTVMGLSAKINREFQYGQETEGIDDLEGTLPTVDMFTLRSIARIRASMDPSGIVTPDHLDEDILSMDMIELVIGAIQSQATTKEEQALGYFTRKKLKKLSTWNDWQKGERKQLNQFEALGMYGEPIDMPKEGNPIILRPHWQYNIKRDGTRRSRLCCNGSKRAAPLLHALAQTYSSCVEHPIQRLYLALAASLNLKIYGADAKDAYGHSPGPEIPTYMYIDDAYAEWYEEKYGVPIDRRKVLPVLKALQGHPESGRLWERHISGILKEIGFISTTHDKTIYRMEYSHKDGKKEWIYMLRQVDDFALACKEEDIAKDIYDRIGKALQTEKEEEPPFAYLGLVTDFNGIDIKQTNEYIEISCKNYIDRVMRSHGWETEKQSIASNVSPMSKDALEHIFKSEGPKEGTEEHIKMENQAGFGYRTLLGELMFCYISCRCDVGYAITLLSKFSTCPSKYHYHCLKGVARYLRATADWGIRYKRNGKRDDLEPGTFESIQMEKDIPDYPEDITKNKLICFVDAAYGNDYKKRRSTTGFAFTYSGGAIVYKSKAQSITALSSTEAELIAAVTAAKTARFIRSVLQELGFPQTGPTPIYEDNKPTIDIVNSGKPTQRSRHIDIRFFAIQDWMTNGDISMHHIGGVINPADDLTKPLGWVLHKRHARYMMGHYNYSEYSMDV